jgi:aminomethyltransferase
MERLIEWDADFVGKLALQRLAETGVDRKLVGVTFGGDPFRMWLEEFWPVEHEGSVVGKLTSASHSFRLERNIGYAWVPIGLADAGTELTIVSPDGPLPATVTELPFLDPRKQVPLG